MYKKRRRTCARCRVHGQLGVVLKGHKKFCPYKFCNCPMCDGLSKAQERNPPNQKFKPTGTEESFFPSANLKRSTIDQVEMLLEGANNEDILKETKRTKAEIMKGKCKEINIADIVNWRHKTEVIVST